MTGTLIKKEKLGHRRTGKMSYEDDGSDWGDASAKPRKGKSCQQSTEARGEE